MSSNNDYLKAREELIVELKKELLGPGSDANSKSLTHEIIIGHPIFRYMTGILYPTESKEIQPTENPDDIIQNFESNQITFFNNKDSSDLIQEVELEENIGDSIYDSSKFKPSAFGLTFLADGNVDILTFQFDCAFYEPVETKDCRVYVDETLEIPEELVDIVGFDKNDKCLYFLIDPSKEIIEEYYDILKRLETKGLDPLFQLFKTRLYGYKRNPYRITYKKELTNDFISRPIKLERNIENLKFSIYRKKINGFWSITIMVSNETGKYIFQPKITVKTEDNNFRFADKLLTNQSLLSEEELEIEMLYHKIKNYGKGHGVSVNWNIDEDGKGTIETDFIPLKEVPPISFTPEEKYKERNYELSMKYYSDLDKTDKKIKLQSLKNFINSYDDWINNLKFQVDELPENFTNIGQRNIEKCFYMKQRMERGLEILENNTNAYNAFQLANRAMFMQRVHLDFQEELNNINSVKEKQDKIDKFLREVDYNKCEPEKGVWRPFQLAFLLLDIDSMVNPESDERSIVDLIWLPTGGGKTEAYLGLIAFTIFYNRLEYGELASGTLVIMRYTLRLLTSQQFERAATLICACEIIRSPDKDKRDLYDNYDLGDEITIGLWIGDNHTPNSNKNAKKYVQKLIQSNKYNLEINLKQNNKFQILKCPFCGSSMTKSLENREIVGDWGYKLNNNKFYMSCTNKNCSFSEELPIQVIDEEIYKKPPTLLFSTVDKFATLPWKGETQNFFGGKKNDLVLPQLIIQDELHLISGALGSVVGIYETALDYVCSKGKIKPKVIASTATIKKAKEQCALLYNREVQQFPPSGLNYDDSFFYRYKEIDYSKEQFGRIYCGIFSSGMSQMSSQIKIISAIMQLVDSEEWSEDVKDKFWTLVAYFNSLRDLGNANTEVTGRIQESINAFKNRRNFKNNRLITKYNELTSRKGTPSLVETMDNLEKIEYSESSKYNVIDLVFATNMISVGLDIPRLNLLLVEGQPKLTSEYIQVTSRIGRRYPGLVLMHYYPSRSRDRSNYEQFLNQHSTLYKFVEPSSITPFSIPTRDRALHSVLIEMLRGKFSKEFNNNKSAINFTFEQYKGEIEKIKDYIIERINSAYQIIGKNSLVDFCKVRDEIDSVFENWEAWTKEKDKFTFSKRRNSDDSSLLIDFNDIDSKEGYRTLRSMRNIDSEVSGRIVQEKE